MRLLIIIYIWLNVSGLSAQLFGTIIIPVSKNDQLSKKVYRQIRNENKKIATITGVESFGVIPNIPNSSAWYLEMSERAVSYEYDKINSISKSLYNQGNSVKKFLSNECKIFINKKYPIINPIGGTLFKNIAIRNRFRKKISKEKWFIDSYLSKDIYLSEGQRILLILSSIENTLNITLGNENY